MTPEQLDTLRSTVTSLFQSPTFRRATFAGVRRSRVSSPWVRVVIRPVELRGETWLQFSYFDAKKDVTKNYRGSEIDAQIAELVDLAFSAIHVTTTDEEIDLRTTKKGALIIGRKSIAAPQNPAALAHNRTKDVPLPEGRADRLLEVMGISTPDGRVRPTMRAKFTQINEFLKHLTHVLDAAALRSRGRDVEILDCGCGSSYLTLAVHHYLNDVLDLPAKILGVDVNDDLIRKSLDRSTSLGVNGLGADRLNFACGPIGIPLTSKPDIVLALHACDTATDDAIAQAIRCEAEALLSVPCCHHDLNSHIRPAGPTEVLRPLLRHGILQQRVADLVTDSFRALALRIMGYKTDIVEFVATEHTPRNLMIRAVRGLPVGERSFVREYEEMKRFWNVTPYIETALGEPFRRAREEF